MKKTVLLLCFAAFFASCKTTKFNTRETVKTGIEVRSDTKEDVRIFEETKVTDNITQLTDELVTVLERIIAVKLSDPDSTGVQFPIEITTTDREYSKEKTVRHDASSVMEQKAEGRMEKGESRRERVEIEAEIIDRTTVKQKTPAWVIVTALIFGFGILIFVFLFLKKYKIL